jgi:sugar lactone lactonase YvrE
MAMSVRPVVEERGRAETPTVLLSGVRVGESPRWHDGRLWFADWGAQEVAAVDLAGRRNVEVRTPSFPFCIDWLPAGQLLVVQAREGIVQRRERDGSLVTHADLTRLAQPPWNDITVDRQGNAYVGNVGFDFPFGEFSPGGIFLVRPDGTSEQVAGDLAFPNGMVITDDGSTLIVAESYASRLTAFRIGDDGGLHDRRVWADLAGGVADGICIDAEGAVWYGDPNGRCVRVREGGEVLDAIELDRGCFACALGGADGRTLFMMANPMPPEFANPTGEVLTAGVAVPATEATATSRA